MIRGAQDLGVVEEDDLMSLDEYCTKFGVSVATARRDARDIVGLAYKVRRRLMFHEIMAIKVNTERNDPQPAWRAAKEVAGA